MWSAPSFRNTRSAGQRNVYEARDRDPYRARPGPPAEGAREAAVVAGGGAQRATAPLRFSLPESCARLRKLGVGAFSSAHEDIKFCVRT